MLFLTVIAVIVNSSGQRVTLGAGVAASTSRRIEVNIVEYLFPLQALHIQILIYMKLIIKENKNCSNVYISSACVNKDILNNHLFPEHVGPYL